MDGKKTPATLEVDIKEIRQLAKKYSPEQIEECIRQQMEHGENVCLKDDNTEEIVGELSKAELVRGLMERGMSLSDALRELARRIRMVHHEFK
ncbi:MAG TPA: hypothetical protein VF790_03455 [Dissulfurispiraceae bacterium]